ncbi:MAG: PilZ domain-containing protein [Alphaproteobacteria bacterium]|nr:PilZ domain-containing protein [Alphaproteobacteria bacterium]
MADDARSPTPFDARIRVDMGVFEPDQTCWSRAVSRYGLILEDAQGVKAGDMVWLHLHVPNAGVIEATAVIRRSPALAGGLQVEFSMFMRGAHTVWESYIDSVSWQSGSGRERRVWPRHDAVTFLVRASDQEWRSGNISLGGVFLPSKLLLPAGTPVALELVHPDTQDAMSLEARVARLQPGDDGAPRGMGVEFLGITDELRDALRAFIAAGDPEDAPPEDVDPTDAPEPGLPTG